MRGVASVLLLSGVAGFLASSAAAQRSPDGSVLVPNPTLVTATGTWTFGPAFPGWQGYWHIYLNGRSAGGGGGHKLVVADGGKVFLQSMTGWFVWDNSAWAASKPPPEGSGPPGPIEPNHVLLKVGAAEQYKTIGAAVAVANADKTAKDYVIEVAPATYTNEFMEVTRPLTIRSAGGPVILRATVVPTNGKGIIVTFAPLTIDGLTFQGAHEPASGNGAGIRDHNQSGGSLIVRNSLFSDNDVGILTDPRAVTEEVTIIGSKFINNGLRSQHALYVNAGKLTVSGSLFCGQLVGHDIKSRASETTITDNQLYDGAADPAQGCRAGTTSLAIDVSNGGKALISGNNILQGPGSPQFKMVSYGAEGLTHAVNQLVVTNNTFASPGTAYSTAIYDPTCTRRRPGSRIADNVFQSIRTQIDPAACP